MKIRHRPTRLSFAGPESQVLTSLLDELRTVVGDDGAADDPVRQRLYPSAYTDDPDAEADYRSITESGLRDERIARIAACEGELATGADVALGDPDVARRWLQVLNDLRLAVGTRLGVTEDPPQIDPADPGSQPWLIYGWLTEVQDTVVHAVMS